MKKAVRVVMAAAGLGILLAGCAKKEPAPETTGTPAETAEETTAEETEEVSKDIFARLSEAPEDAEAQIAVLAREVSTWAPDTEEYAGFWTGCAAADLDHNGRLEIIVSAAGGTGMFTTTRIWEVNEQKDGISEVKWEKEEGDSEPDALGSIRQTAYIDEDSELIYYIAPDYTRNGAAENYETLYALSLNDGEIMVQDLAGRHETADASGNVTAEFWDSEGSSISEEEYEAAADAVFGNLEKAEFSLIWLDSENLGTEDGIASLPEEKLISKLQASFDGFGFEKAQ